MSEPQLQFHFTGTEARTAADEIAGLLSNEFSDWRPRVADQVPSDEGRKVADPFTITLVILSIPPAILASWDIAQRIKLKPKIDKLISWAKDRSASGKVNPSVVLPEGKTVPLHEAAPQQILDAIAAQATAQRKET